MVTGTCPGAGASTLASAVAEQLREQGQTVLEVDEDAVWGERQLGEAPVDHSTAWPEFRELLHEGKRAPSARELLEAFRRIHAPVASGGVWIQDWSWLDLGAMMPWAQHDRDALEAFARSLRAQAAQCGAVLLHVVVDPVVGLHRAIADRGTVWFDRHSEALGLDMTREVRLQMLAQNYRQREFGRRQLLDLSGWERIDLDGEAPLTLVTRRALEALDGVSSSTGPSERTARDT